MAGVRVKIKGEKRLEKKLARIPVEARKGVRRAVAASVAEVQREAILAIRGGSRSGVIVTRGGKPHQRSAPGEPPKTDTGRLVGSIFAEVAGDGLTGQVGTDVAHGEFLEFGTQKMAARPWLFPAFDRLKPKIKKRIADATREALRTVRKKNA